MLIVCPSCATPYMIDQAALGPAGRTVRCARCRTSWFAGGPEPMPNVTAVAETVAAEAQPRSHRPRQNAAARRGATCRSRHADKQGATQSESVDGNRG